MTQPGSTLRPRSKPMPRQRLRPLARDGRGRRATPTVELDQGRMAPSGAASEIELLGDAESVVNLDAEVANSAFELPVTKKKLDRSQIAGLAVDLGRFGASHRMRPVGWAVKASLSHPSMDNASILTGREMSLAVDTARKQEAGR